MHRNTNKFSWLYQSLCSSSTIPRTALLRRYMIAHQHFHIQNYDLLVVMLCQWVYDCYHPSQLFFRSSLRWSNHRMLSHRSSARESKNLYVALRSLCLCEIYHTSFFQQLSDVEAGIFFFASVYGNLTRNSAWNWIVGLHYLTHQLCTFGSTLRSN